MGFEGCPVFSEAALDQIARLGGMTVLSASHPHSYGALPQLQDRFDPELCLPAADFTWRAALQVSWPYDDFLEPLPGLELHRTAGHFDGHAVLYDRSRKICFCGDALKFELDPADLRRATTISAHKAFVRGVPLTPTSCAAIATCSSASTSSRPGRRSSRRAIAGGPRCWRCSISCSAGGRTRHRCRSTASGPGWRAGPEARAALAGAADGTGTGSRPGAGLRRSQAQGRWSGSFSRRIGSPWGVAAAARRNASARAATPSGRVTPRSDRIDSSVSSHAP